MNSFRPGGRLLKIKHSKFSMPLPERTPEIPELKMTAGMRESLSVDRTRNVTVSHK